MSGEDSEMMERPSISSSGLAGMSSNGTQSPSNGTPGRLSFKERMMRGAAAREAKAQEGLTKGDDWDVQPEEESKPGPEPLVDSRSLPLRGEQPYESTQSHNTFEAQMFGDADSGSDDSYEDEDRTHGKDSLPLLPLKAKNEYVVLTPVVPSVRDIYNTQIKKNDELVSEFIADYDNATPETLSKVGQLINDLKLIGDHQDLFVGATDSQQNISHDTVAKRALSCSPKCLFLKELFDSLRNHDMNIAVLARPGMTLDILTSILEAEKISYLRQDNEKNEYFESTLRVTLLPTGFAEGSKFVVSPVDAVIAFDWSFFAGEQYTTILRSHPYDPNLVAPLIHLVTDQSAEHVELALSDKMDPAEREAYLAMFTTQQTEVGMHTEPRPEQAAPPVANWLIKCKDSEFADGPKWPLNQNTDVCRLNIPDGFRQEQSGASMQPFSLSPTTSKNSQRVVSNKRTREVTDEENTKRMRMTPIEDAPSGEEVSRVADSMSASIRGGELGAAQSRPDTSTHWTFAQVIADRNERQTKWDDEKTGFFATIADLQAQLRSKNDDSARVRELEASIRDKDAIDKTLRAALHSVEVKLAEHVEMVKKFEPKYKELTFERNVATNKLAEAWKKAEKLGMSLEQRTVELNNAKQEINRTQEELKEATNQLLLSSIPEVRELEELKRKLQAAEEEKEKALKSKAYTDKDCGFFQEQYQNASSSAASLGREVEQLREENKDLQKKADENRVQIQKIQEESAQKQLNDQIEELKEQVEDLKAQMQRKAEELKKKGDRSLRGMSGAQSPMVGNFGGYGRNGGA